MTVSESVDETGLVIVIDDVSITVVEMDFDAAGDRVEVRGGKRVSDNFNVRETDRVASTVGCSDGDDAIVDVDV